ncbi:MAG: hypothetical protein AAF961_01620 [Planctomycetota bacterium]
MPAPKLSADPPKPAPRPTKKRLALRDQYQDEIDELRREANDKAKLLKEIDAELFAYVRQQGDAIRCVKTCGYELAIVSVPKSVAWAAEFVKACGQAAAEKVRRSTKLQAKLEVRKL